MANEAHIRIDKGIKKGPRKASQTALEARRASPKADLGSWVIPADLNPHSVLERFLSESTTSHIAGQYGLSRKALVKWLRATVPNEWKETQLLKAHCKLDEGEEGIDEAERRESAISLACARERIKAAQWRLQALDDDYRPKQELTVAVEVSMDSILEGECERLLDKVRARICASPHVPQVIDIVDDAVQQESKNEK